MEIDDEGPQAALSIETIPYVVKIRIQTASSDLRKKGTVYNRGRSSRICICQIRIFGSFVAQVLSMPSEFPH